MALLPNHGELTALQLAGKALILFIWAWVAYKVVIAVYSISPFHPLHKYPGSRLAASSFLYEGYYDFILGGRYTRRIQEMHEQYGPLIRINPEELHCSDSNFVAEVYAGGSRKRDKWQYSLDTGTIGPIAVASISTVSHDLHRMRRLPMNRFFSRAQMLKLESEVLDFAQRTCDKILRTDGPFDLKEAFNCFTADIISQYAFGEPMGFIGQVGWEPNFSSWVKSFLNNAYLLRHVAPVRAAVAVAPLFANYMGEDMRNIMNHLQVIIPGYIEKALADRKDRRIFADLIESEQLPDEEKTAFRLSGEGFTLLSAGTETTAASLTCISYYVLEQPQTYSRLIEDLQGIDVVKMKWTELEQRPYLWAVIHEALRLMPGVSSRSSRIAPTEDLVYTSQDGTVRWIVPKGTPISMTPIIQHSNKELFPQPEQFIAERWLVNGRHNYALEKHLLSFGRGSRGCLGKDLAYCELFIMTALLALRVLPRARLHETSKEDVEYDHDLIVPQTRKGSIRVQVTIS